MQGVAAALVWMVAMVSGVHAGPPRNLDFAEGKPGETPPGWFVPTPLTKAVVVEQADGDGGKVQRWVEVCRTAPEGQKPKGFGNLMQSFDAKAFRGKRIAVMSRMKVEKGGDATTRAQMWVRVDRAPAKPGGNPRMGFFDNIGDRPVTDEQWQPIETVGPIAADAEAICVGLMLFTTGSGKACLGPVTIEEREVVKPVPLSDRGLENLVAFARVMGYVRHFHPSDQAASADWDAVAIDGVKRVEGAKDAAELAAAIEAVLKPYAPTMEVKAGTIEGNLDPATLRAGSNKEPTSVIAWRHNGLGFTNGSAQKGPMNTIYSSNRVREPIEDAARPEAVPAIGSAVVEGVGGGVWCRVPITLYATSDRTLPEMEQPRSPAESWPESFHPSADDRATRLATVALAWNGLQHFYPYFDVVEGDWATELPRALKRAATDEDAAAFVVTLQLMTAALHDGHANVGCGRAYEAYALPLAWTWAEGKLVITVPIAGDGGTSGPRAGDEVVSINGVPAGRALEERMRRVSGSTDGWIRWRALDDLRKGQDADQVTLVLRSPDGVERTYQTARAPGGIMPKEKRPKPIEEVKPGIWYVDIDRIDDKMFKGAVGKLKEAKGIVFDLRGYPNKVSTVVLSHLIDEKITCARWNIPVITWPDGKNREWSFSNWTVSPMSPRLKAKAAFVIDGRAISYAETYMSMVEHYKLAAIVGQPTAGTNGNVNSISLPGGCSVVFTGMKVLRHDTSQYHGKPVMPTVPVERTVAGIAAGKDELLEKAIEVVEAP